MSVSKNLRKEAIKTNPMFKAYELMRDLSRWIINDFGVGYRSKEFIVFTHGIGMNLSDEQTFKVLQEKYGFKVEASFPQWLLEYYRTRMLNTMDSIMHDLSDAYSIYPQTMYQFNIRYQKFSDAINNLIYLKVILQEAIDVFPTNLEKYIPYTLKIDEEIKHTKDWRRSCNSLKKICLANDADFVRQFGGVYYNPGLYYGIIQNNPYIKGLNEIQMKAVSNFVNGNYSITGDIYNIQSNNLIPCCFILDNNSNIIDYCI